VTKIAAMRALAGHPAMLDLLEVFLDTEGVHVVIEYLHGHALFDAILKRRRFSERDAADVMRQLLEFLAFQHAVGIVHRDIKPENLYILADKDYDPNDKTAKSSSSESSDDADEDEAETAETIAARRKKESEVLDNRPPPLLKVIDFGSAAFCERGQRLHTKFGTVSSSFRALAWLLVGLFPPLAFVLSNKTLERPPPPPLPRHRPRLAKDRCGVGWGGGGGGGGGSARLARWWSRFRASFSFSPTLSLSRDCLAREARAPAGKRSSREVKRVVLPCGIEAVPSVAASGFGDACSDFDIQ